MSSCCVIIYFVDPSNSAENFVNVMTSALSRFLKSIIQGRRDEHDKKNIRLWFVEPGKKKDALVISETKFRKNET